MTDDFDLAHDKLPDQPTIIGGDKSAAAWHPNNGPEVPHADLIARLRAEEQQVRDDAATGLVASSPAEMRRSAKLYAEAADALAALGDTVPRVWLAAETARLRQVLGERDEARSERDALAHVIEQVREQARREDHLALTSITAIEALVTRTPAVSLALHDAEVWDAGARWGFNTAKSNHDWQTSNPYRAAAIREEAN